MKKLRLISFCIGIPLLFAIFFFSFAPEPRTNAVKEWWRRVNNDPGQSCLDYTRKKLKDPSSIRLIEWHKENDGEIILNYKATNSYNAYVNGTQKCSTDKDVVNEKRTELMDIVEDLKMKNAEAEERIKLEKNLKRLNGLNGIQH